MTAKTRNCIGILSLISVLAILMFVGSTTPSHAAQGSPTPTTAVTAQVAKQSIPFDSLQMINVNDGWATAGGLLDFNEGSLAYYYVLHTHDGGKTWMDVTPPDAFDASEGFDGNLWVWDDGHAFAGPAWKTSDGGQSWKNERFRPDATTIDMVVFVDPSYGWSLDLDTDPSSGNNVNVLYQSKDGGASWHKISDVWVSGSPMWAAFPTGLVFASRSEGWLILANDSFTRSIDTDLLHTQDGGRHWQTVDPPLPSFNTFTHCNFTDPQAFKSGSFTFLASCDRSGDDVQTFICHTDNGGRTWQITRVATTELQMIDATTGWMISSAANAPTTDILYQTLNGGKTWTKLAPLPEALTDDPGAGYSPVFDFIDSRTGWAIDSTGNLQFTTDSGKTWRLLNAHITPTF